MNSFKKIISVDLYRNYSNSISSILTVWAGAGEAVPTVRQQSERFVRDGRAGAGSLVRINPTDTRVPAGANSISVPLRALDALERLERLV